MFLERSGNCGRRKEGFGVVPLGVERKTWRSVTGKGKVTEPCGGKECEKRKEDRCRRKGPRLGKAAGMSGVSDWNGVGEGGMRGKVRGWCRGGGGRCQTGRGGGGGGGRH